MREHVLTIDHPVYHPGEGFLLGNGDISVSIFSRGKDLVIKLGKNDLWDTRLDLSRMPAPADIEELRELVLNEKFHCDGPSGKLDLRSCDNPRLKELCTKRGLSGTSPAPKPAAELILHTCGDLPDMQISQKLFIEAGKIEITLHWGNGVELFLSLAVHPQKNLLAVSCQSRNYGERERFGGEFFGIVKPSLFYFELTRPDEKSAFECARQNLPHLVTNGLPQAEKNTGELLPPAEYTVDGDRGILTQNFPDCKLTVCGGGENWEIYSDRKGILFFPADEGADMQTFMAAWEKDKEPDNSGESAGSVFGASAAAGEEFFRTSRVEFADKSLDDLYHVTMHAKRASFKAGKLPPGLILASTLNDYSSWHGDYHLNYNYQSAFLGDFAAGHFDTGDAFFTGLAPLLKLGEFIAKKYYHARGCFVQLSGFPFETEDDYMGNLPFGRMAYMTGWVAAWFYRRWDLSGDRRWLERTGYPALKKFALFYTDFLTLEEDGFYHAFPSNQGEEDYSLAKTRDQVQVLRHARGALSYAVKCASELGCDPELREKWQEILDKLIPVGMLLPDMAAEFAGFDGQEPVGAEKILLPGTKFYDWYPGQMPYFLSTAIRNGLYDAAAYEEALLTFLRRWGLPNGLFKAMAVVHYGHEGYWSEGLGIAGTLLDMLAVNCAGVLKFFSGITGDAEFENLRLDGGFICSASRRGGVTEYFSVKALHCREIRIRVPETFSGKVIVKSRDDKNGSPVGIKNGHIDIKATPGMEIIGFRTQNQKKEN